MTTTHLIRWAAANGNYARIHWDLPFAQLHQGLPNVVVNGSLKNQYLGQLLLDYAGDGGWFRRFYVEHRGMDFPGDTLTAAGIVTGKREENELRPGGLRRELAERPGQPDRLRHRNCRAAQAGPVAAPGLGRRTLVMAGIRPLVCRCPASACWSWAGMCPHPYCGKLLADYGADVIKIEPPGGGDEARRMGPFVGDDPHPEKSIPFLFLNTNKRGITLDVDTVAGAGLLHRLLESADVLVAELPAGGQAIAVLAPESLGERHPHLGRDLHHALRSDRPVP